MMQKKTPTYYRIQNSFLCYYRMWLSEYLYSWEAVGTVFGVDCHPALTQETFQF